MVRAPARGLGVTTGVVGDIEYHVQQIFRACAWHREIVLQGSRAEWRQHGPSVERAEWWCGRGESQRVLRRTLELLSTVGVAAHHPAHIPRWDRWREAGVRDVDAALRDADRWLTSHLSSLEGCVAGVALDRSTVHPPDKDAHKATDRNTAEDGSHRPLARFWVATILGVVIGLYGFSGLAYESTTTVGSWYVNFLWVLAVAVGLVLLIYGIIGLAVRHSGPQ